MKVIALLLLAIACVASGAPQQQRDKRTLPFVATSPYVAAAPYVSAPYVAAAPYYAADAAPYYASPYTASYVSASYGALPAAYAYL